MDWSLLGLSFTAVFLSELGDKSQVAAIALGGSSNHPKAVFFGTAGALLLTSLIGVLLGEGSATLIPPLWIKGAAAIGFLTMGLKLVIAPGDDDLAPVENLQDEAADESPEI
jgi:putative Ca2+/H+ antiporter (TMEM165/GDT1 family)